MLASTIFDFESCAPTFNNIKLLTSFAGSPKVSASVPPYSAYLLLTSSMNSKLNFRTLLLILHLVYNTMGQRKSGLVGYCTLMTSRSCLLARALELQAMLHVCQEWSVRNCMQINTHTEDKSHGFFRDPLPPKGPWWPAPTCPNPTSLSHPRTLPNFFPLLLPHY